jgi:hypothetical protein
MVNKHKLSLAPYQELPGRGATTCEVSQVPAPEMLICQDSAGCSVTQMSRASAVIRCIKTVTCGNRRVTVLDGGVTDVSEKRK